MNKFHKLTIAQGESAELTFDVGVNKIAINNNNGIEGGGGIVGGVSPFINVNDVIASQQSIISNPSYTATKNCVVCVSLSGTAAVFIDVDNVNIYSCFPRPSGEIYCACVYLMAGQTIGFRAEYAFTSDAVYNVFGVF